MTTQIAPAALEKAAHAAEMRLIGLLLERPTPAVRTRIDSLAAEVSRPELRALAQAAGTFDEPSYVALLGPGGPVSPREVSYRRREDPGGILADVSAFYEAFGYRPRAEDPADHVAVEAGFVSFLLLKEAYLLDRNAGTEVVGSAREKFANEHLAVLASGLAARLESVKAPELLEVARALRERTGNREVAPREEGAGDDGEMTCGSCGSPPA